LVEFRKYVGDIDECKWEAGEERSQERGKVEKAA
jgi:hypothetical protein